MLTLLLIYSAGAVITNMVLYHHDDGDMDHAAVNIASAMWPVVWVLYMVLAIEKGIKWLWSKALKFINIFKR